MALMEPSMSTAHHQLQKCDYYDNLFDQFVDADSFDMSNNTAADRGMPGDWNSLLVLPDSRSGTAHTGSPSLQAQRSGLPHRECNLDATVRPGPEQFVSLASLDSIQNLTHLHLSELLGRRNNPKSAANHAAFEHGPRSVGVGKSLREASVALKMSHRQQSRKQSSNKNQRKAVQLTEDTGSSNRPRQRPLSAAPASAPIAQTAWPPPQYPAYATEQSDSTLGSQKQLVLRHNTLLPDQPGYQQSSYSPLSSPHAEHSEGEEMSSYLQSPEASFFAGTGNLASRDFGSYSRHEVEHEGFPVAGMPSAYGLHEFVGAAGQPWWSPSVPQPYDPNPAFSTASEESRQHVTPAAMRQSKSDTGSGLTIKRETDVPRAQFGNTRPSQSHQSGFLTVSSAHSQPRQDQLAEPHRRSPSLSPVSSSARKTSSSGRPKGVQPRRSWTAGPSARREPPGEFVNLTPDDSQKLLTGVAPSGSSKTKARREKEVAERQRKLGLAAAKAVRKAGGDMESLEQSLERQGLVIDKEQERDEDTQSS